MANPAIKRARDAIGINQEELADDVGLSTSQISRFENGERDPRATEIVAMARRLKVTIDELMEAYLEPGDEELLPENTDIVKLFRQATPDLRHIAKKILTPDED